MSESIPLIVSIISAIGAMASIWISLRKAPAEINFTNTDAAGKVSAAAIVLVEPLQKRLAAVEADLEENCAKTDGMEVVISRLTTENNELKRGRADDGKRITALEDLVGKLQAENSRLINWASRLVAQLQHHDIEPEPFDVLAQPPAPKRKSSRMGGEW